MHACSGMMGARFGWWCRVAWCIALTIGCTRSHETDPPDQRDAGDQTAPRDARLCARMATIQCEGEARCCSGSARDAARCASEAERICTRDLYLDEIAAEVAAGFDEGAAELVWAEFERRTLACDPAIVRWLGSADGLRGIFPGTRGLGEACDPVGGVGNRGTIAAALASCRLTDGLACLPNGLFGAWSCAPRQATGASCITDDNCRDAGACNNFSQATLGLCIALQPVGVACTAPGECESLYCIDGRCTAPDADEVYCPSL